MTTYIYLDNYRGFNKSIIPITQVNWLVGENSTGKTSFLAILEIFSAPSFWYFEPSFQVSEGEPKHFLDLVSVESKSKSSFTIGIISFGPKAEAIGQGIFATYIDVDGRASLERFSMVKDGAVRTIDGRLWAEGYSDYRHRQKKIPTSVVSDRGEFFVKRCASIHASVSGFKQKDVVDERRGMPLYMLHSKELFGEAGYKMRTAVIPWLFSGSLVELAPIRTKPKRTYDAPQTQFSPEGNHTPYVIQRTLAGKLGAEFQSYLNRSGAASGLFKGVAIRQYGESSHDPFELHVTLNKSPLRVENVGYGVSQSLPVIVEMFMRPPGTSFAIQQPEVHLHPKAQASFGDIVADLARDEGKVFFIETHSDFAIDRFRLNLRKKGHSPAQLLFFARHERGNSATSIEVMPDGSLPDSQPAAYREFFYNESLEMLS